ncbi:HAD family hydrolase [Flexibacterium corallicola]|uniref:HAD family hydrolase n=1 Tax=Flexibacterium corallicola TaxID=3037259 RepID=UPI00286EF450|nr:HAD family hydrolase [Pseudovibrio sp. M1P-2-3]
MTTPVLVFDLDGTLVDSMGDLTVALNHVLVEAGYEAIEPESVRHMVGAGVKVLLSKGLKANKVTPTPELIEPLMKKFIAYYENHIAEHSHPYEGVIETVKSLREQGWKTAVCTNKLENLALSLLKALDIRDLFDAVVGGDTFSRNKPDAMPVYGAIDKAGGIRSGSVFVGDSKPDVDAARNAALPVIAVNFGYSTVPVKELRPDVIISHFNELESAIERTRSEA